MRTLMWLTLPIAMIGVVAAQEPAEDGGEAGAAAEAEGARHWEMEEREFKRYQRYLEDYLQPGKRTRQERFEKLADYVEKDIDGHSVMEDVSGLARIANEAREINTKAGRRGRIEVIEVRPEVHGFPGGIGTVRYTLYLPEEYSYRELWPLIFCLPDNRRWPDQEKYLEKVWIEHSEPIAQRYILAVPHPQTKDDAWTEEKSLARAMIALRHVSGTFDQDDRAAGPATDMLRMFLAGGPDSQEIAARFAEMFVGAVFRGCRGTPQDGPDLLSFGGVAGLPALSIHAAGDEGGKAWAERLEADNPLSEEMIAEGEDLLGDGAALAAWLDGLPPRRTPTELEYAVHDTSYQRHHWIVVRDADMTVEPAPSFRATADRAGNEVRVEVSGIPRFELFLNDALVDLDEAVRIVVVDGEQEFEFYNEKAVRDLGTLLDELVASNHPWRIYPVRFLVDVPALRRRAEERAAAGDDPEAAADAAEPTGSSAGGTPSAPLR